MHKFLLISILSLLWGKQLFAQEQISPGGLSLETIFHYGTIFKHSEKMDSLLIDEPTYELEVNLIRKTNGRAAWQQFHNYPTLGLAFYYVRFSNLKILGRAYALLPNINWAMIDKPSFTLNFRIGSGLAYLSNPFHVINNKDNIAIGSRINNISSFAFYVNWQLYDRFYLKAAASFTHFSNASYKLPNLGLNTPTLGIGLGYKIRQDHQKLNVDSMPDVDKKIHFNVRLSLGAKEYLLPGSPKYYIYISSLYLSKNLNHKNRLSLGTDIAYNSTVYAFIVNGGAFQEKERIRSVRISIFFGDEIVINKLSLLGQLGVYIYNPFLMVNSLYSRLGIQYNFLDTGKIKMHTGVYLKSHYARADYFHLGVGITL